MDIIYLCNLRYLRMKNKTLWNSVYSVVKTFSILNSQKILKPMKKELVSKILHFVITVLTAIVTTFGVTSCMGM